MITIDDIRSARAAVAPFVHRTPLIHSGSFSRLAGAEVFLKAENLQKTGSFKVRGAFNKLLTISGGRVIAASMGNHAQAVAYAARSLGLQARIVMPLTTPIVKQEATRGYGAEVVLHGNSLSEALDYARSQKDCHFVHPFDDDLIIAGQGTLGIEIVEDLKEFDVLLVPVGGGGLISGIAVAVKALLPRVRIIGVQSLSAPSVYRSLSDGQLSPVQPSPTIADGIAVGRAADRTFEIIRTLVDDVLLVPEDRTAAAILLLMERKKLVVEGAGAVTLAALLDNTPQFEGARAVLVLSGGNIDFTVVDRIVHKGLVASGKVATFGVTIDDLPGALHALTGTIASHRINTLDISHDRFSPDIPFMRTRVILRVESRGTEHLDELLADLAARGYDVSRL